MIICAKAKRKKDGTIDIGEMADIRAIPEQNIAEIVRENGGKGSSARTTASRPNTMTRSKSTAKASSAAR